MSPLPRKKKDNEEEPEDLEILVTLEAALDPEAEKERQHRIDRLVQEAGFDHWHATRIAALGGVDWRDARDLRRRGCPQALIYELLR